MALVDRIVRMDSILSIIEELKGVQIAAIPLARKGNGTQIGIIPVLENVFKNGMNGTKSSKVNQFGLLALADETIADEEAFDPDYKAKVRQFAPFCYANIENVEQYGLLTVNKENGIRTVRILGYPIYRKFI